MKVRVELQIDSDVEFITSKDIYQEYLKLYKHKGLLYDHEADSIYYVADVPYLPLEGQTLNTRFGICTVIYSLFDIDGANSDNALEYSILVVKAL
jgi:hypothetical protein